MSNFIVQEEKGLENEIGELFVLDEGREMVDEGKARDLIKTPMSQFKDFKKVSLTNKSFSLDAARVLAEVIAAFPSVESANLADMIAGRPEDEALQVLKTICDALQGRRLLDLDLSDNALGQKGIKACHGVLKGQDQLESLKLCNNGLSVAAMDEVYELMTESTPTKLRTLHFYNNMSGDGGAEACAKLLAHCPELTDFRFSGTRALRAGSLAVGQALQGHFKLVKLDLADNLFAEENGEVLANGLAGMALLESLNLRDVSLEDEAAIKVLTALQATAPSLSFIDLSGNDLTGEAGPAFARMVASKAKLITILAEDNYEFAGTGTRCLAAAFRVGVPALESIQLNSCGIPGSAAMELANSLCEKRLKQLELNANCLSDAEIESLKEMLLANGDSLGDMEDNEEDDSAEDEAPEPEFIQELEVLAKAALERFAVESQPEQKEQEATSEIGDCFILEEGREMVDAAKAASLVAKATESFKDFRSVSLTNKSFSEDAAEVLAGVLSGFSSVVEADLADMIAGRPEEEALKVLKLVCDALAPRKLRAVDLSDNALGQKGIKACHGVLKEQEELESLKLCNNGLSEAAMEEVAELLMFRIPTKLKTLHFYNNMSGNNGAVACAKLLPHCPHLEDFRFSGTRALQPGSLAIANSLKGHPSLHKLDLADNTFTGDNGKTLAAALVDQPVLEHVNLRDTSLEDEACAAVIGSLCGTAPNLRHLDLSGNDLTSESGCELARLVSSKPFLTHLYLEDNFELGENLGLRPLARALSSGAAPGLAVLQLNSCGFKSKTALALTRSLANKPIVKFEMNCNSISDEGKEKIELALKELGLADSLGELDDLMDEDSEEEDEDEETIEEDVDEIAALTSKITIN